MTRWLTTWGAIIAACLAVTLVVMRCTRPPAPAGADAAGFSEERALRVVRHLSEDIGVRVAGTPACARAARYLLDELRSIPGLEVELVPASGEVVDDGVVLDYRVENVVARLAGTRPDAILLGAHFDSPPESPGAADNAAAVGALVDLARILSRGERPANTVILLFNGGEEAGLVGADGFRSHRWAADVRAFINLDAVGVAGLPILFQSGPGAPWLVDAYARVPRPFGTILGQDLFRARLINSDTDGRILRGAGWPGLDLALFENGYLYHTPGDRPGALESGSIQALGDNLLALVRDLGARELTVAAGAGEPIYFDILARAMFVYGSTTATILALIALALAIGAAAFAIRRGLVRGAAIGIAAAFALLGLVLGAIAAVLVGVATGSLLDEPHGWFAHPRAGIAAYGAAALLGQLAPQLLWLRRRGKDEAARAAIGVAAWAGGAIVWSILALVLALLGVGSGYLALLSAIAGALGLAAAPWIPPRWRSWWLLGIWSVSAVAIVEFGRNLVELFVPMAGRMPTSFALDPVIALVIALPVLSGGVLGAAFVHRAGRPGFTAGALGLVCAAGAIACAVAFPYTAREPKRILVRQLDRPDGSRIELQAEDFLAPAQLALSGAPAQPSGHPLPAIEVTRGVSDQRTVVLTIAPSDAYALDLELPRGSVAAWSARTPLAGLPDPLWLQLVGRRTQPYRLELTLRGSGPVRAVVSEHFLEVTPAVEQLRSALPAWCASAGQVTTQRSLDL